MAIPLNYESVVLAKPRISGPFCLLALGGGALGFIAWCALDFVFVRFAPSHIRSFDWLMLLFPFAVCGIGAFVLRQPDSSKRVGLAIAAAIVASVVAVDLLLFLGIRFHLVIGGKL